jgi:hypothetical protein
MSNDLTKNPWLIDSAASTVLSTNQLRITAIRFVGATTAGHECKLTDQNGVIIFSSFATAANFLDSQIFPNGGLQVSGLIAPTLGSGKVYVYLRYP